MKIRFRPDLQPSHRRAPSAAGRSIVRALLPFLTLPMLLASACRPTKPPPNLLLVTLDTTRADHLSVYGYQRPTTPALERLAARGVRFDAAYAPIAITTPAHATLFTSLPPTRHGVRANVGDGFRLPLEAVTLAERLHDAGFATAAFVGAYTAGLESGLNQGFAVFREPDYARGSERRGDVVTDEALGWIDAHFAHPSPPPCFVWVHLFDPHGPYQPPSEDLEQVLRREDGQPAPKPGSPPDDIRRYDGEIHFADAQIHRLIQAMDARGPLVVAVVADHGETLTERPCGFHHGHNVYEEQVHVPWLLAGPGLPAGLEVKTPVPTLDLAPTLLGALGLKPPASFTGRDLMPLLSARREPSPTPLFFETGLCDPARCSPCTPPGVGGKVFAARVEGFKLIRTPTAAGARLELYDLGADPGETHDLATHAAAKAAELTPLLLEHFAESATSASPLDPTSQERLRALGYTR